MLNIKIDKTQENERIDKLLMPYFEDISRSKLQNYIKDGIILVNNQSVKVNYKVKEDDCIQMIETETEKEEVSHTIVAQNIPLDIVYEDDFLMVVNKPKHMVTHPAPGHYTDTLVNALLYHTSHLSDTNGELRRGIVHRLDQDTTGLLLICKTNAVHELMAQALKNREVKRFYQALVVGKIKEDFGTIDAPIGRGKRDRMKMYVTGDNSKQAITHFTVLQRFNEFTLIGCELDTGRTHQIRVHLNYIGYPIFGDQLYGNKRNGRTEGQYLHAYKLVFKHPITNEEMLFEQPLPEYFANKIKTLSKEGE